MKPKPIPQPPVYDPSVDEKKMIELKRLRGNRNITTAIKAIKLMMLYKNEWVS